MLTTAVTCALIFLGIAILVDLVVCQVLVKTRGRPTCPTCGYVLLGEVPLRCSECGRVVRRESDLRKARSARLRLTAGVVCVVLAGAVAYRHAIIGLVVERAPVALLLRLDDDLNGNSLVSRELRDRRAEGRIPWAVWKRKVSQFVRESSGRPHAPWVQGRARWPVDVPAFVRVSEDMEALLSSRTMFDLAVVVEDEDGEPFLFTVEGMVSSSARDQQVGEQLDCRVAIRENFRRWQPGAADDWRVVESERVSMPTTFVASLDDCMQPVTSTEIQDAIRFEILVGQGDEALLSVVRTGDTSEATVAMDVTIRVDGVDVGVAQLWIARRGSAFERAVDSIAWLEGADMSFEELCIAVEHQRVGARVRANPVLALRDFDSDVYWLGEFTVQADRVVCPY